MLNDIFRYILDEEEEVEEGNVAVTNGAVEEQTAAAAAPLDAEETVPATLTSSNDPVQQKHGIEHIDRKLEEEVLNKTEGQQPDTASSVEVPAVKLAEDAPVAAVKDTSSPPPVPEQIAESLPAEDQPEKPRDPDPTPIASPPKPTKVAPAEVPAAPPKLAAAPKTWANLVASKGITAATAPGGVKAPQPATPAPLKPRTTNSSTKESTTPPTTAGEEIPAKPQQNGGSSGWQMAGTDNKQRPNRQHSQSVSSNQDNVMGYVKNVTEKVDASLLRATLTSFGRLAYFDVSRQKV